MPSTPSVSASASRFRIDTFLVPADAMISAKSAMQERYAKEVLIRQHSCRDWGVRANMEVFRDS